MDSVNYGKIRTIIKERDNQEFFTPFINRLRQEDSDSTYEDVEEPVEEATTKTKRSKKG